MDDGNNMVHGIAEAFRALIKQQQADTLADLRKQAINTMFGGNATAYDKHVACFTHTSSAELEWKELEWLRTTFGERPASVDSTPASYSWPG